MATLREGAVTQFGPTSSVYREPADLSTARVFSDPPINTAPATKTGRRFHLSAQVSWPAEGRLGELPDGSYTVGLRPHNVLRAKGKVGAVPVDCRVLVAEISGSESVVHFDLDGMVWVSLSHGVHGAKVGEKARFELDVAHCLYFAPDGARVGG